MTCREVDSVTDRAFTEVAPAPEMAISESAKGIVGLCATGHIVDSDAETVPCRQLNGAEGGLISDKSKVAASDGRPCIPFASQSSSTTKQDFPGHGTVKFGDNSITTDGVADVPIYLIPPSSTLSNFLSKAQEMVQLGDNRFRVDQGALYIRSWLEPVNQLLGLKAPVLVEKPVFGTNSNAMLEDAHLMTVKWGSPIRKGVIDRSILSPYMIGHLLNSETINDVMQPQLPSGNYHFWMNAASALDWNLFLYDNSAIYVKLVYWALVLDYLAVIGQTPAYNEFGADDTITWIDLSPADTTSTVFLDEVAKGSIMLVENRDFVHEDLLTILWMAREGCRVRSVGEERIPDMAYVKWPSIKVCILANQARPTNYPTVAAITPETLLGFAYRLAASRNEHYDLCRAVYYALDICGVRYATDNGVNYRMDTFYSLAQPVIPFPNEHSLPCRLLSLTPPNDAHRQSECDWWLAASSDARIRLAAFYVAGMQVFTTTQLYAVSLTTANLVQWAAAVDSRSVIQDYVSSNNKVDDEPMGYEGVKRAFIHYTGFSIEQGLYPGHSWHVHCGAISDAAQYYAAFGCASDFAPRLGSVLALDNFLLLRPQEWGVPGPHTTVNFETNLELCSNMAKVGLYSHKGDSTYRRRAGSRQPHFVTPYGVLMLNVFSQYFELPDTVPRYIAAECFKGDLAMFSNVASDYKSYAYNAELHIYEPCTLQTYDFSSDEIRAPVITAPVLTEDRSLTVRSLDTRRCLSRLGFVLERDRSNPLLGIGSLDELNEVSPKPMQKVSFGSAGN